MFLSTHEKQLDAKRRLLVPQDFRAAALKPFQDIEVFEGVYCFGAIDAPCLECGGAAHFATYREVIEEYPKLSPTRRALENRFYAAMHRLSFDQAGRITLPEALAERFDLSGDVILAGQGVSFQIWNPRAYAAYEAAQNELVAKALALRGQDLKDKSSKAQGGVGA